MLIIGAKGFAKEVLELVFQLPTKEKIVFFDNISPDLPDILYGKFEILRSFEAVSAYFLYAKNKNFTLGVGDSNSRRFLSEKITALGGELVSVISPFAHIGQFGTTIEKGVTIATGTVITNDVHISEGCLLNLNCTIGHDVKIGKYTVLCPGVHISGHAEIGDGVIIGTGAVILPHIFIGEGAVVGAGAVVNKSVAAGAMVVGVPAREISH